MNIDHDKIFDSNPFVLSNQNESFQMNSKNDIYKIPQQKQFDKKFYAKLRNELIGIPGKKGQQGRQGIQGLQGDEGPLGIQGLKGEKGLIGMQGLPGLSIEGPEGLIGKKGSKGIKGSIGIKGDQGKKGEIGIKGPTGEQGLDNLQRGNDGKQGFQGPKGITGVKGIAGLPGIDGKSPQGLTGDSGVQGKKGELGKKGEEGLKGPQGQDGIIPDIEDITIQIVQKQFEKIHQDSSLDELILLQLQEMEQKLLKSEICMEQEGLYFYICDSNFNIKDNNCPDKNCANALQDLICCFQKNNKIMNEIIEKRIQNCGASGYEIVQTCEFWESSNGKIIDVNEKNNQIDQSQNIAQNLTNQNNIIDINSVKSDSITQNKIDSQANQQNNTLSDQQKVQKKIDEVKQQAQKIMKRLRDKFVNISKQGKANQQNDDNDDINYDEVDYKNDETYDDEAYQSLKSKEALKNLHLKIPENDKNYQVNVNQDLVLKVKVDRSEQDWNKNMNNVIQNYTHQLDQLKQQAKREFNFEDSQHKVLQFEQEMNRLFLMEDDFLIKKTSQTSFQNGKDMIEQLQALSNQVEQFYLQIQQEEQDIQKLNATQKNIIVANKTDNKTARIKFDGDVTLHRNSIENQLVNETQYNLEIQAKMDQDLRNTSKFDNMKIQKKTNKFENLDYQPVDYDEHAGLNWEPAHIKNQDQQYYPNMYPTLQSPVTSQIDYQQPIIQQRFILQHTPTAYSLNQQYPITEFQKSINAIMGYDKSKSTLPLMRNYLLKIIIFSFLVIQFFFDFILVHI